MTHNTKAVTLTVYSADNSDGTVLSSKKTTDVLMTSE